MSAAAPAPASEKRLATRLKALSVHVPDRTRRTTLEALTRHVTALRAGPPGALASFEAALPWSAVLDGLLDYEVAVAAAGAQPVADTGAAVLRDLAALVGLVRARTAQGSTALSVREALDYAGQLRQGAQTRARATTLLQALVTPLPDRPPSLIATPAAWPTPRALQLPPFAALEEDISRRVTGVRAHPPALSPNRRRAMADRIAGSRCSEEQQAALRLLLDHRVCTVAGQAGTGKTVVILTALDALEAAGVNAMVLAPTNKACEVLRERGVPSAKVKTPFAALGNLVPSDLDPWRGPRERANPTGAWAFCFDESGMIDLGVLQQVLAALLAPDGTPRHADVWLILFGDPGQLKPVGVGQPYYDLVASRPGVPGATLRAPRRAAGLLSDNNARIYVGDMPVLAAPDATPASRINALYDPRAIPAAYRARAEAVVGPDVRSDLLPYYALAEWIVDIVAAELPAAYPGLDPRDGVQVLTPQEPGPLGYTWLGRRLGERLNDAPALEDAPWYEKQQAPARVGDRIMVNTTDKDLGIINGRVGVVTRFAQTVEKDGRGAFATVGPDGAEVLLPAKIVAQCQLRYAMTIHRSQGSEWPHCLSIVTAGVNEQMLTRSLVYTGHSRARVTSGIVGTPASVQQAVANCTGDARVTTLAAWIAALTAAPRTPSPVAPDSPTPTPGVHAPAA